MKKLSVVMACVMGVLSCSDDNFQEKPLPELMIEGTNIINLQPPTVDDKPAKQSGAVRIRNTGKDVLQITKLQWEAKPDRLEVLGARGNACIEDSECGGICLSGSCVDLGFADLPIEVSPSLLFDIEFVITKGGGELNCPAAPAHVPEEFKANYCGSLVIETNAQNSTGFITSGNTTIYMQRPVSSGQIEIIPEFIEFQLVQPGTQHTKQFSVRNTGSQVLRVDQIFVSQKSRFFSFAGDGTPLEIEAGGTRSWSLTITVPEGEDPSAYEGFTELVVESSAGNRSGGRIPVEVTAGAGSAPLIVVDQSSLSFHEQSSQTFTIENAGDATLMVTGFVLNPMAARAFYQFKLDGQDVTSNFQPFSLPKGQSREVEVVFDSNASEGSPVATLQINHNDTTTRTEIVLLGAEGNMPLARILPQGFTFQAEEGAAKTRTFVIRNVGTAPLEITGADMLFSLGDAAEFSVSGHLGTIPAGGLKAATVTFTGANTEADQGRVVFTSNNASGDIDLGLRAVVAGGEAVDAVITSLNGNNDAVINRPLRYTSSSSAPEGVGVHGLWTLVERPAGSQVFFSSTGNQLQFVPDVVGTYRFAMLIHHQLRESEAVETVSVVAP